MNPGASERLSSELRALEERMETFSFHPIEDGEPVKNKFQCPRCLNIDFTRNMVRYLDGGSIHCAQCGLSFHKCRKGCSFGSPMHCEHCIGKKNPLTWEAVRVIFSIFVLGILVIASFGWYLMTEAP